MTVHDLETMTSREPMSGFRGRFIHTDRMTIVHWDIESGARLPEHSHPHEQVSNLLAGEFEMVVGGRTHRLTAGTVCVIDPNVAHSGHAVTDCQFIDVFCPVREDYTEGPVPGRTA